MIRPTNLCLALQPTRQRIDAPFLALPNTRLRAAMVDLLLFVLLSWLCRYVAAAQLDRLHGYEWYGCLVAVFVYLTFCFSKLGGGQTLGMRLNAVVVRSISMQVLPWYQAMGRAAWYCAYLQLFEIGLQGPILRGEPYQSGVFLLALFALFVPLAQFFTANQRRQRYLHDLLSQSQVLDQRNTGRYCPLAPPGAQAVSSNTVPLLLLHLLLLGAAITQALLKPAVKPYIPAADFVHAASFNYQQVTVWTKKMPATTGPSMQELHIRAHINQPMCDQAHLDQLMQLASERVPDLEQFGRIQIELVSGYRLLWTRPQCRKQQRYRVSADETASQRG